jgi:hypothetical protein
VGLGPRAKPLPGEATIFDAPDNHVLKQQVRDAKIFVKVLACSGVVYYYITKSPKHPDDGLNRKHLKETIMNTSISTKLAALALALMVNSVIMGGVAYLFNVQLQTPTAVMSLANAGAPSTDVV